MKIVLLLFAGMLLTTARAQDYFQQVEALVDEAVRLNIFSGVVLIADKENVQFHKAYGNAEWENQIPNLTDTKFNIGSIGKLFTQIMITQLIQEGKLNLDDNLKKIYPLYNNEYDERITVKHLLSFTSGLGDYFMIDEFRMQPDKFRNTGNLVSLIAKQPLHFEPGTSNRYSNSGYVALGGIIEKLTGKSYEENLKEKILNRLGMTNSGFIYKDTKKENTAKGYVINPDGSKESTYERLPNIPTAAGGMYASAEDLLKLDRSLMNDNALLNDEYKTLLSNRFNYDESNSWQELITSEDFGNGYAGGSPGWNAVYVQNTAGKYTVIALSNFDNGAEPLVQRINSILKEEKYPPLRMRIGVYIHEKIREKGIDDFVLNHSQYLSDYPINNDIMLNWIGYQFLNTGLTDEAIAVFRVNTILFPDIANTYDSLAEAYMVRGEKELAIKYYKKSLELDPLNKNAENRIKEMQ